MGLESANYIADLVATNPVGASDDRSTADDHIRLIKAVLQAQFPNFTAAALQATNAQIDAVARHVFASVSLTTPFSITSESASALTWDAETLDASGIHASGASLFVAPAWATKARFTCKIEWAGSSTGYRFIQVLTAADGNLSPAVSTYNIPPGTAAFDQTLDSGIVTIVGGTSYKFMVTQNCGSGLNVNSGSRACVEFFV